MTLRKIFEAFELAERAHRNQKRKTGEPYIFHPTAVAQMACERNSDDETICACLLHDVVEDTPITLEELRKRFGEKVAFLVNGVTKKDNSKDTFDKIRSYAQRDNRVVLVKLLDRIHNTGELHSDSEAIMKTREKYKISNPWYIELGRELGYHDLALELEKLTERLK